MLIERGDRRVAVIGMGLLTLIIISLFALFSPAHSVGILTVTGGAVGIVLSFYFGADATIKKSNTDNIPKG